MPSLVRSSARRSSAEGAARSRCIAIAFVIAALVVPASAHAHAQILPSTATLRQEQEFALRIPTEGAVATVSVALTIPPQITTVGFARLPGWTRRILLTGDHRVRGVIYSGGRIEPGEYADFRFLATPFSAGTVVWDVAQTFADGTTKPWTGTPEAAGAALQETGPTRPGPAPATRVVTSALGGVALPGPAARPASSAPAIWLGVIAIVIAALSTLAVGFLWSTRPAALPEDGEDDLSPGARRTVGGDAS